FWRSTVRQTAVSLIEYPHVRDDSRCGPASRFKSRICIDVFAWLGQTLQKKPRQSDSRRQRTKLPAQPTPGKSTLPGPATQHQALSRNPGLYFGISHRDGAGLSDEE